MVFLFLITQNNLNALADDTEYGYERESYNTRPNVNVDIASGAFNYSYPIEVPPGRNGLQPDLKLNYNNQNTKNDSMFGYGWDINIPYIERINR